MHFHVITLFEELFGSFLSGSLLGKAIRSELVGVRFTNPRDFATDRHRTVDDSPFGGGSGMVLKPDPIVAAVEHADVAAVEHAEQGTGRKHRILLSPQGAPLTQATLKRLAGLEAVTLVCGRYEGFDERISAFVDEEISLGDFVLNGGEVAAMAIIDGVSRLLPGVIGNPESLESESHGAGLLEYPQYTRPRSFRGLEVPQVLLDGDHAAIAQWRRSQMLERTRLRRPDLFVRLAPSAGEGMVPDGVDPKPTDHERRQCAAARTYVALLHYPVHDKSGAVVTTALTNLDLHDIARSGRSYGIGGYFIVTPLTSQQELAERILSHWRVGHGARVHDKRREALSIVRVAADLDQVVAAVREQEGEEPLLVATSARGGADRLSCAALLERLSAVGGRPAVLLLGTGWGLTEELMSRADLTLGPIQGPTPYNHLSVRSAAAILLDRCFGMREEH